MCIRDSYNLNSDPGETDNLAEKYPEKKVEMMRKLSRLQKETGALFPVINSDYSH